MALLARGKNKLGNGYSDVDLSSNLFLSIKKNSPVSLQNISVTNSPQIHERTKEVLKRKFRLCNYFC